jgi:hypothetical protein
VDLIAFSLGEMRDSHLVRNETELEGIQRTALVARRLHCARAEVIVKRNILGVWMLTLVGAVHCGGAQELDGERASGSVEQAIRNGPIVDAPDPSLDAPAPRPTRTASAPFHYADLRVLGTLRFYEEVNIMEIPVINDGDTAVGASFGTVHLGSTANDMWDATLLVDGAPTTVHTLPAGATGVIQARYTRAGLIEECKRYRLQIDVYHEMQIQPSPSNGYSVYANDSAIVKTPCPLRWTSTIDATRVLGIYPSEVIYDNNTCADPSCLKTDVTQATEAGPETGLEPILLGKTLVGIVSSYDTALDDTSKHPNYKCFDCHNEDNVKDANDGYTYIYRPQVRPPDQTLYIDKDDPISYKIVGTDGSTIDENRRTWAGPQGWAMSFVNVRVNDLTEFRKDAYMRQLMQKWIDDGWQ